MRPGAVEPLPGRSAALCVRGKFCEAAGRRAVCRGNAASRGPGDVSLYLGLHRPAQGRRAVASQPPLGHRPAPPRQQAWRPARARRGTLLSHECARRVAGGAGPARHGDPAAGLHGGELYRGGRELSRHDPDLGADDDRDDTAREGAAGAHRPVGGQGGTNGLGAGLARADGGGARAPSRKPRSPTAMARQRPGRSSLRRTRMACRPPICRSASRIRTSSCGWSRATAARRTRACWRCAARR